jgi:hypothetical protein
MTRAIYRHRRRRLYEWTDTWNRGADQNVLTQSAEVCQTPRRPQTGLRSAVCGLRFAHVVCETLGLRSAVCGLRSAICLHPLYRMPH